MPEQSPDAGADAPPPFSFPSEAPAPGNTITKIEVPDVPEEDKVKKKLGLIFWIASGWVVLVLLLAIFADLLPLPSPSEPVKDCGQRFCNRLPPGPGHIFGTDQNSRDIFSRIIYGGRISMMVGVASIVIGMLVGGTIGIIAGYFRGTVDSVLMSFSDIVLAFPPLLLALAIVSFRDSRTVANVVMAIAIVSIPPIARLVRANTLVFTQREFVLASRTLGASHLRVIVKEVLPNVMLPIFSFAIIGVAIAIIAEGGLAFLGLSVQPPTPTWGDMINFGVQYLQNYPHITLIPCAVMFLTILSLNLAGDRMREYLDVKDSVL